MYQSITKAWVALAAAALIVSGCGFPESSREKAQMFFDEGREKIVESLEDQGVEGEQLAEVNSILDEHEQDVVEDLSAALDKRKDSFKALYTGQDTDTLVATAETAHEARLEARRTIGAMHADIEAAVGAETWAAANEQRRKEFEEHFEEEED